MHWSAMEIHCLPAGPIGTNAYLLMDTGLGEALLVDAPHGCWSEICRRLAAARARLVALLLTHGHWDHTGDAAAVQESGVRVFGHEADRLLFERPEVMEPFSVPGFPLRPVRLDQPVAEGDRLHLAGQEIEVRHVPGHCPGNVLFHFPGLRAAFVGDALFAGSIGRTDFPGGGFEMLERSIRTRIYTLPGETTVYPGHGPETTVARERVGNPYVAG